MINISGNLQNVDIIEVKTKSELNTFIKFPLQFYQFDNFYAPQLIRDMKTHFSKKNPFFKHADVKFFLALRDGHVAGRVVSIINHHHIKLHNEKAGFFGFFECINDGSVFNALMGRVYDELKDQGMEIMRGPMNFSSNEEWGFLIKGFDIPPMLMTPYNPPYYNDLVAEYGMVKVKELYAFIYDVQDEPPEKVLRISELSEKRGIKVRTVDKKNFISGMQAFKDVYNSAWAENWGFLPLTDEELLYSAKRLKPLSVPELTLIAEKDGEPVGFIGLIPDYNVVLRQMHGKLNPATALKALYYSRKITDLRLLLLGVKAEYRNRGIEALLIREGFKGIKQGNYSRLEFSWILQDNIPTIKLVEIAGGRLYKKYGIYEKVILRDRRDSAGH